MKIRRTKFSYEGVRVEYDLRINGAYDRRCDCPDCQREVDADDLAAPFCREHYVKRFGEIVINEKG